MALRHICQCFSTLNEKVPVDDCQLHTILLLISLPAHQHQQIWKSCSAKAASVVYLREYPQYDWLASRTSSSSLFLVFLLWVTSLPFCISSDSFVNTVHTQCLRVLRVLLTFCTKQSFLRLKLPLKSPKWGICRKMRFLQISLSTWRGQTPKTQSREKHGSCK